MPRVNLLDFGGGVQKGLWVGGPRERTPSTNMRRLTGVNNLRERELRSRNGTVQDVVVAAAHSLTRFDDVRFQGETTILRRAGVSIDTGYDGTPLEFEISEPRVGTDAEFLFVCGGGQLRKVDTTGAPTNWGIAKPTDVNWGTGPGGSNEQATSTTNNGPQTDAIATTTSAAGWETNSGSSIILDTVNVPSTSGIAVCVTVQQSTNEPGGEDEQGES